jgi:hypothetical protein
MDAITSVWLLKKFLPGWEKAVVKFVPAGDRVGGAPKGQSFNDAIEEIGKEEYIQSDTGMGPLDHHQTQSNKVCATTLTFDFVKKYLLAYEPPVNPEKVEALQRMVKFVLSVDHFQEIFRAEPLEDYNDFSVVNILDGLKLEKPNQDEFYVTFISQCLDALLHDFENKIWAEREIRKNGIEFETKWGKGLGIESINDSVIKLGQLMGYVVVARRDPRKGYLRIKTKPNKNDGDKGIDLTLVCEQFKKMDPDATWFLHVSKKMLLNGSPKNPKMKPTKLPLSAIIEVLKTV